MFSFVCEGCTPPPPNPSPELTSLNKIRIRPIYGMCTYAATGTSLSILKYCFSPVNCSTISHLQRVRLAEVKKQEQELLENQSIPLRNYLMKHVMPTLSQGLIECCKIRPDDPIDFVVSACPGSLLSRVLTVLLVLYQSRFYHYFSSKLQCAVK